MYAYYSFQERGINMLFVLGGNGTHAGANAIHNEVNNPLALYLPIAFDVDNFVV